jgi:hypothetical protein
MHQGCANIHKSSFSNGEGGVFLDMQSSTQVKPLFRPAAGGNVPTASRVRMLEPCEECSEVNATVRTFFRLLYVNKTMPAKGTVPDSLNCCATHTLQSTSALSECAWRWGCITNYFVLDFIYLLIISNYQIITFRRMHLPSSFGGNRLFCWML